MATDFDKARSGIQGRQFQTQVLELLERIAVALEKQNIPPFEIHTKTLEESGFIDPPEAREKWFDRDFDPDAKVCTCGDDWSKTCSACSGARLARVYQEGR